MIPHNRCRHYAMTIAALRWTDDGGHQDSEGAIEGGAGWGRGRGKGRGVCEADWVHCWSWSLLLLLLVVERDKDLRYCIAFYCCCCCVVDELPMR